MLLFFNANGNGSGDNKPVHDFIQCVITLIARLVYHHHQQEQQQLHTVDSVDLGCELIMLSYSALLFLC